MDVATPSYPLEAREGQCSGIPRDGLQTSSEDERTFTACHNAFDVPELAEAIFLNLRMYDNHSIVIQTCRHWKAVVDNSIKLQQFLFLKPISATRLRYFDDEFIPESMQLTGRWSTSADDPGIYRIYAHPLLSKLSEQYDESGMNWTALSYPEAIWRHALAMQPPVTEMKFGDGRDMLHNDEGLTLEDLTPAGFGVPASHGTSPRLDLEMMLGFQELDGFIINWMEPRVFLLETQGPSFVDLQHLVSRPHKSHKTPMPFCD